MKDLVLFLTLLASAGWVLTSDAGKAAGIQDPFQVVHEKREWKLQALPQEDSEVDQTLEDEDSETEDSEVDQTPEEKKEKRRYNYKRFNSEVEKHNRKRPDENGFMVGDRLKGEGFMFTLLERDEAGEITEEVKVSLAQLAERYPDKDLLIEAGSATCPLYNGAIDKSLQLLKEAQTVGNVRGLQSFVLFGREAHPSGLPREHIKTPHIPQTTTYAQRLAVARELFRKDHREKRSILVEYDHSQRKYPIFHHDGLRSYPNPAIILRTLQNENEYDKGDLLVVMRQNWFNRNIVAKIVKGERNASNCGEEDMLPDEALQSLLRTSIELFLEAGGLSLQDSPLPLFVKLPALGWQKLVPSGCCCL